MTLSPRSQFLSQLKSFMLTDPPMAKQLVVNLAAEMRTRASQGGGTAGASAASLAKRLQSAADSGDLASLFDSATTESTEAHPLAGAAYSAWSSTRSS